MNGLSTSVSNDTPVATSTGGKIGATVSLFFGSALAYVFVLPILAHFWFQGIRLQPTIFGLVSGVLLWIGVRNWTRWRLPLGIIWLLLSGLAFFNSTYYRALKKLPELTGSLQAPAMLDAMSRGSVVLGCVALVFSGGLLAWHRSAMARGK
jgi:hypothetical protein